MKLSKPFAWWGTGVLFLLFGLYFLQDVRQGPSLVKKGKVIHVYDGDTILVLAGDKKSKVRLIGLDAPELKRGSNKASLGEKSREYTRKELLGEQVWLTYDVRTQDRFDRVLAYVWLGNPDKNPNVVFFNEKIVEDGFARAVTYQPNTLHQKRIERAQRRANE